MIDTSKVTNVKVEGIDTKDYPDFCDAYITEAEMNGRPCTEAEIEELNDDAGFVYECVVNQLF